MAAYDKSSFYWLQLKEDFFDEDAIDWLEEQPNGKEYSLFYLKLCLKSLRTNGILIRRVGDVLIPYNHVKLGELTKTNPDTVAMAMTLLMRVGLVKTLDNGEFYLTQVENMIGTQSKSAFKKQQQIARREKAKSLQSGEEKIEGGKNSTPLVEKIPPEIEKDIDIEIETEQDTPIGGDGGTANAEKKTANADTVEEAFDKFWSAYPKKINKEGCYKAFKNIKGVVKLMPEIMKALDRFKRSQGWTKENGKYIPYPLTWLHQERWKDEWLPSESQASFDETAFFEKAVRAAMNSESARI